MIETQKNINSGHISGTSSAADVDDDNQKGFSAKRVRAGPATITAANHATLTACANDAGNDDADDISSFNLISLSDWWRS